MYKRLIFGTALGLVMFTGESLAVDCNLTYQLQGDSYVVTGASNKSDCTTVNVPATYEGKPVTSIGYGAFDGSPLTSVDLPNTLKTIEKNAFVRTTLTSIDLPDSLESIGHTAFHGTGIKELTIPASVTEIIDGAFTGMSLDKVNILGENVKVATGSFGSGSVKDMNYVGTVTWSCGTDCVATLDQNGHAEFVGTGTMNGAEGFKGVITSATIGEGITSIGYGAFDGSPLTSVDLPDTLKTIEKNAFVRTTLTSIDLPDSLESIGDTAFYDTGIREIILPPNLIDMTRPFSGINKIFYYSDEQKEALKALGFADSKLTPYIINDDGTVYYTDKEGFDIRFKTYNTFKKGEVLEKYKLGSNGEKFVYSADNKLLKVYKTNPDGSTYIYDENGKLKEIHGKKIYTVEEAMAVTRDGNVNRVRLTYK